MPFVLLVFLHSTTTHKDMTTAEQKAKDCKAVYLMTKRKKKKRISNLSILSVVLLTWNYYTYSADSFKKLEEA